MAGRPHARPEDARYTRVAIALHWITALLVIANLAIGLLVLALAVARLAWRLAHRPPPLPRAMPRWERWLARANHWAFYALLVLLPLSGWVFTSAGTRKYPTDFFGLFAVPPIVGQDAALSDVVATRHVQLAYLMIALILLHVAGALKHRFADRDAVLGRMLPGAGPR